MKMFEQAKEPVVTQQDCKLPEFIANKIFQALMGQRFEDWHKSRFDDFVTGEENCATQDEIIQDIVRIFNLKD